MYPGSKSLRGQNHYPLLLLLSSSTNHPFLSALSAGRTNHGKCESVSHSVLFLCNPTNCSPPGSSVHGILQARISEWVAMPSSRGSSRPRGSNPGLPHCRQILYRQSHQGSPNHGKRRKKSYKHDILGHLVLTISRTVFLKPFCGVCYSLGSLKDRTVINHACHQRAVLTIHRDSEALLMAFGLLIKSSDLEECLKFVPLVEIIWMLNFVLCAGPIIYNLNLDDDYIP